MKPVYVAPIVAYLCHEDCTDTGGVFEVNSLFLANTLYCGLCHIPRFKHFDFFPTVFTPFAYTHTLHTESFINLAF